MTTSEITADRLASWARKLALNNATPFALIGIGQGPGHSGEVVLCVTENGPSDAEVAKMLHGVANRLVLGMHDE